LSCAVLVVAATLVLGVIAEAESRFDAAGGAAADPAEARRGIWSAALPQALVERTLRDA